MAKRFIISEEERSDIRSRYGLLNEQDEEHKIRKGIQCFLNKKGFKLPITGEIDVNTKKAIQKFQLKAGLSPANGNWIETNRQLNPEDIKLFKQCMSDEGDIIDKGLHFIGLD
jgi:hypothetical protein